MVVAKGRNLLAEQIKQVARWHGIAIMENPPLAHALYRSVRDWAGNTGKALRRGGGDSGVRLSHAGADARGGAAMAE